MNRYSLLLCAPALIAGQALAAPLYRLPGIETGAAPIKALSVHPDAARIPALGQTLAPMASPLGTPAQDQGKPAMAGLQGEWARIQASAQSGQSDGAASDGAKAAFDGALKTSAAPDAIPELNKAVAEILKPLNNNLTKASVTFNRVETDGKRAVHLDVTADYAKKGPDGDAAIKMDKLVYAYPDGGVPKTDLHVGLEFNLHNIATQDQINKMGPDADKMVANFLADYAKRYGAAATIDARVTRKDVDAQGNLTALALTLGIKVDLSKLPPKVDPKDVQFTEAKLDLEITLKGADITASVTSNPKHRSFEDGQQGLKEFLDGLLARDAKQLRMIKQYVQYLDYLGTALTDKSRRLF